MNKQTVSATVADTQFPGAIIASRDRTGIESIFADGIGAGSDIEQSLGDNAAAVLNDQASPGALANQEIGTINDSGRGCVPDESDYAIRFDLQRTIAAAGPDPEIVFAFKFGSSGSTGAVADIEDPRRAANAERQ